MPPRGSFCIFTRKVDARNALNTMEINGIIRNIPTKQKKDA